MNVHELLLSIGWLIYDAESNGDELMSYITPDHTLMCDVWADDRAFVMCAECHLDNVPFSGSHAELAAYLTNGCPDTAHDCMP